MLDVCLLGTGGMMPLPYRRLTALMTRYNGSNLLIDCGEGTQVAIKEKGWSFKPIDVICFTHYHADHISGLPGTASDHGKYGPYGATDHDRAKRLERVVSALRVIAPELPFPIEFIELTDPKEEITIAGYRIQAYRVNHNIVCYGYSLSIDRGRAFQRRRGKQTSDTAKILEPPAKRRDHRRRRTDLYAGNGAWTCQKRDQSYLLYGYQTGCGNSKCSQRRRLIYLRRDVCRTGKGRKGKTIQAHDFL